MGEDFVCGKSAFALTMLPYIINIYIHIEQQRDAVALFLTRDRDRDAPARFTEGTRETVVHCLPGGKPGFDRPLAS
jgi:hypothetical protein